MKKDFICKIWILTFFIILFSILLVIFLILGGYIYKQQQSKILTYIQDLCQVQNISYKSYSCPTRYSLEQCYFLKWKVNYGQNQIIHSIIIEYNLKTLSDVFERVNQYKINSSSSCWYDRKNSLQVQWEQPEIRTAIILLISGGLLIVPILITICIGIKYCKLEKQQEKERHLMLWMKLKTRSFI